MAIAQNYPNIVPSLSLDFANVKALDPRITFTRASTATYYGTETAKAEENLFVHSTLPSDTSFGLLDNTTKTASQTGPDGSANANLLNEGTSTDFHQFRTTTGNLLIIPASTDFTVSFFVKDVDTQYVAIALRDGFNIFQTVEFDLTAETVNRNAGANVTLVSSSITAVGGSWYRCVLTYNTASTTAKSIRIGFSDGTSSLAITTGNLPSITGTSRTFFLFGPQAEIRSAATAYTPTTTQPITNFIPVLETAASGVARFDHNPVTKESLGLLIEEQRTNLLLRSEEFDNAFWLKTNSTVTANQVIAPDGTLTGDELVISTEALAQGISSTSFVADGTSSYTASFYIRKSGNTLLLIYFRPSIGSGSQFSTLVFNTETGFVSFSIGSSTTSSHSVTDVGGWWRVSTTAGGIPAGNMRVHARFSSQPVGRTIGLWGAQLEDKTFPTSYIPTSASQVTRAADAASMTGANFSSWYNAAEGTLFAEAFSESPRSIAGLGEGTFVTNIVFNGLNLMRSAGTTPFLTLGTGVSGLVKLAGVIKPGDFAASANGSAVVTSTANLTTPFTANILQIGSSGGSGTLNGTISKISYYPVRVTNEQLTALTS